MEHPGGTFELVLADLARRSCVGIVSSALFVSKVLVPLPLALECQMGQPGPSRGRSACLRRWFAPDSHQPLRLAAQWPWPYFAARDVSERPGRPVVFQRPV